MDDAVMDARPRLLKIDSIEYLRSEYIGNRSRFHPIGDRVMVLCDRVSEETTGHIIIPGHLREQQELRAETGVIVELGEAAFTRSFDRTGPWRGRRPEVGDRVYFQRFAGRLVYGYDGQLYRVMDDVCIAAIEDSSEEPHA